MSEDPMPGDERRQEIAQTLAPRLISEPLKSKIERELNSPAIFALNAGESVGYEVIIELNLNNPEGRAEIRGFIMETLLQLLGGSRNELPIGLQRNLENSTHPYIFATLTARQILQLVDIDGTASGINRGERLRQTALRQTGCPATQSPDHARHLPHLGVADHSSADHGISADGEGQCCAQFIFCFWRGRGVGSARFRS